MYRIKTLLRKHLRGEITAAEQVELQAWLDAAPENRHFFESLRDPEWVEQVLARIDRAQEAKRKAWDRFQARITTDTEQPAKRTIPVQHIRWRRWAMAAIFIGLLGTGAWWLLRPASHAPPVAAKTQPTDVLAPATIRATISLSNGQQVYLDSAVAGTLAHQGNVDIIKGQQGQIAYQPVGTNSTAVMYNTLNNPRGSRVVDMTLSDGSHVWLNAASSIRYPTVFAGSERQVEITGEAYFEVAKNAGQPFIVSKGMTRVQVLGTHFNVNAYDDEQNIKVTLLEGGVSVQEKGSPVILQPGQQAIVDNGIHRADHIDLEAVMAWKNGLFSFNGTELPAVMRQLARWYGVDIRYEGAIPDRHFNGEIDKTLTLDQVLKLLTAMTRLRYTILGNQLTIRP